MNENEEDKVERKLLFNTRVGEPLSALVKVIFPLLLRNCSLSFESELKFIPNNFVLLHFVFYIALDNISLIKFLTQYVSS